MSTGVCKMGGRKPLELSGKRFGRLLVISQAENNHGNTYWNCVCDCGNKKVVKGVHLTRGITKSCGCYSKDLTIQRNKNNADGKFRDERLYRIYYGMRTRCYNEDDVGYEIYGARGITVCEEWLSDFLVFQDWAFKNGYREDLTIDRIDNNGNYEPSNCRWADFKTQCNNRRTNRIIKLGNEEKTVSEWSLITGISRNAIYSRLKKGWSGEDAISIPVGKFKGGVKHSHWDI